MNAPYHYDSMLARDRRQRMLREAEQRRLADASRTRRPAVYLRLLGSVGDWMIAGGTRLKARHQAALEAVRASRYQHLPGFEIR
ncbi:MAG: hypothetical protein HZC41_24240 [Chloroflexi bacterium]|nr:hypothetical protein [Chloroflexota bacterium]